MRKTMEFDGKSLCHCGSCEDAYNAAQKLVEDMVERDCPVWALQVAVAMNQLSFIIAHGLLRVGLGDEPVKEISKLQQHFWEVVAENVSREQKRRNVALLGKVALFSEESGSPDRGLDAEIEALMKKIGMKAG